MSPRIRCSKPALSGHPKDSRAGRVPIGGALTILGHAFTANETGPSGPEDHALGVMRDGRGQLMLTAGSTRIPVDEDDLRRIGDMCAATAATV